MSDARHDRPARLPIPAGSGASARRPALQLAFKVTGSPAVLSTAVRARPGH